MAEEKEMKQVEEKPKKENFCYLGLTFATINNLKYYIPTHTNLPLPKKVPTCL